LADRARPNQVASPADGPHRRTSPPRGGEPRARRSVPSRVEPGPPAVGPPARAPSWGERPQGRGTGAPRNAPTLSRAPPRYASQLIARRFSGCTSIGSRRPSPVPTTTSTTAPAHIPPTATTPP